MKNSGDTTWVTQKVIREYTAGQAADVDGAIDAFRSMSKSKESESLRDQLDEIRVPVRLLVGGVPHPSGVKTDERELLAEKIPDFALESVAGVGPVRPRGTARRRAQGAGRSGPGRRVERRASQKSNPEPSTGSGFCYCSS